MSDSTKNEDGDEFWKKRVDLLEEVLGEEREVHLKSERRSAETIANLENALSHERAAMVEQEVHNKVLERENEKLRLLLDSAKGEVKDVRRAYETAQASYEKCRAEAPSGMGALDLIRSELKAHPDETSLDAVRRLKTAAQSACRFLSGTYDYEFSTSSSPEDVNRRLGFEASEAYRVLRVALEGGVER